MGMMFDFGEKLAASRQSLSYIDGIPHRGKSSRVGFFVRSFRRANSKDVWCELTDKRGTVFYAKMKNVRKA